MCWSVVDSFVFQSLRLCFVPTCRLFRALPWLALLDGQANTNACGEHRSTEATTDLTSAHVRSRIVSCVDCLVFAAYKESVYLCGSNQEVLLRELDVNHIECTHIVDVRDVLFVFSVIFNDTVVKFRCPLPSVLIRAWMLLIRRIWSQVPLVSQCGCLHNDDVVVDGHVHALQAQQEHLYNAMQLRRRLCQRDEHVAETMDHDTQCANPGPTTPITTPTTATATTTTATPLTRTMAVREFSASSPRVGPVPQHAATCAGNDVSAMASSASITPEDDGGDSWTMDDVHHLAASVIQDSWRRFWERRQRVQVSARTSWSTDHRLIACCYALDA